LIVNIILVYTLGISAIGAILVLGTLLMKERAKVKDSSEEYGKLMYLKKSSETRMGLVGEQLAPYLEEWPFPDARQFRLISSPIDGVNFGDDEVSLVEIKTGKSRLSKNQKRIKELIRQGKVSYIEFRVGEKGCEVKRTVPNWSPAGR